MEAASDPAKMDGSTITDGPNPVQKDGNEAGEREQEVLKAQLAGASVWLSPARFVLSCMSVFDGFVLAVSTVAAIVGGVVTPLAMVGLHSRSFQERATLAFVLALTMFTRADPCRPHGSVVSRLLCGRNRLPVIQCPDHGN
jgi:hypothetical protein